MVNLKEIDLSNCDLKNLEALKEMINLEKINLGENAELKDMSAIKNLVNLKEIDLSYCNLKNLEAIKEMTNLEKINLGGN